MRHRFWILALILISLKSYTQDLNLANVESINAKEELDEIKAFLQDFISCSSPQELHNHIVFPNFQASHYCGGTYSIRGLRPYDSTKTYLSDQEIKTLLEDKGCSNPIHFAQIKFRENKQLRDSLQKNGLSLEAYCFSSKDNQIDYLSWFIEEYQLPVNYSSWDFENVKITENQIYSKHKSKVQYGSMILSGFGYHSIEIYKMNGEFKVKGIYVGYD